MAVRSGLETRASGWADAVLADPGRGVAVQRRSAPGKATLAEHVGPWAVQARGGGDGEASPEHTQAVAAHGTRGPGGPLPYLSTIQRCFGRHDVSGVQAHSDPAAAHAASAIGAEAFATGHHVAFAAAPSLHTAAHEAAHVVQQRGGVALKGGVGETGDPYEQHADAVADRVVRGESAEALLDAHAGAGRTGDAAVQRMGKPTGNKPKPKAFKPRPQLVADLVDALESNKKPFGPFNTALFALYTPPKDETIEARQHRIELLTAKRDELIVARDYLQSDNQDNGLSTEEAAALTWIVEKLVVIEEALAPPKAPAPVQPVPGANNDNNAKPTAPPKADNKGFQEVKKPTKSKPLPGPVAAKLKPVTRAYLMSCVCKELNATSGNVVKLKTTVELLGKITALHITMPSDQSAVAPDDDKAIAAAVHDVHVTAELYGADDKRNPRAFRNAGWKATFPEDVPKNQRAAAAAIMEAEGDLWDKALAGAVTFIIGATTPMY